MMPVMVARGCGRRNQRGGSCRGQDQSSFHDDLQGRARTSASAGGTRLIGGLFRECGELRLSEV
jgi:hypothetical protein